MQKKLWTKIGIIFLGILIIVITALMENYSSLYRVLPYRMVMEPYLRFMQEFEPADQVLHRFGLSYAKLVYSYLFFFSGIALIFVSLWLARKSKFLLATITRIVGIIVSLYIALIFTKPATIYFGKESAVAFALTPHHIIWQLLFPIVALCWIVFGIRWRCLLTISVSVFMMVLYSHYMIMLYRVLCSYAKFI